MSKSSGFSSRRNQQSKRILRAAVMSSPAVLAALSATSLVRAADLYWDINGPTPDGASTTTAAGTWNAGNTNWSTDPAGAVATQVWGGAGNNAVFAAGTGVTGAYTVTVTGTQALDGLRIEEGTLTLTGGALNFGAANGLVQINNAVTHTISSDIQGTNGFTRTDVGANTTATSILTLSGAKTYSGVTTLNAGVTRISNANGLGVADNTLANGTVIGINVNNKLEVSGGVSVNEALTLTNWGADALGQLQSTSGTNTWAGDIRISGQVNNFGAGIAQIGVTSGSTLVVTGEIKDNDGPVPTGSANTNAWSKEGPGTLVLRHSNTNHTGLTRVFDGVLRVEADGALGQAVVYTPNVGLQRGTFLAQLSGKFPTISFANNVNYTTNDRLQTSGNTGTGGRGVIDGGTGNNTYGGDIALSGSSPLLHEISVLGAGDSLTLSGKLYQTGTGTARHVHKTGAGTLIITGHNDLTDGFILSTTSQNATNDQYHMQDGEINVDAGNLVLKDGLDRLGNPTSGALATSVPIFVNLGATFTLDNSAGVSTTRLANTTALTLSQGEVKLIGNAATSVNQPAGALSVASYSIISVSQPANTDGATTTFSLGTLTRANRGTALIRGMDNVNSFIGLSGTLKGGNGSGSLTSILTEVVGDNSPTGTGTDFVTISGGNARTLTAGEYIPLASGNTTLDNTTVTAATPITTDTTVNSVKLTGGNTVSITAGKTLQISSGGILGVGAGSSTFSGGRLTFDVESVFTDPDTGDTSLTVVSSNEGIVTVPTGSSLNISSNLSGATGLTKSGAGTLTLTGTNNYGNGIGGQTTINAGVLEFNVDANLGDAAAPIFINGGTLRPLQTSTSTRNVNLASPGTNTIETGSSANFTVTGVVSGLTLTKDGTGILALTNTGNTYTGGTIIKAGTMYLDAVNVAQPTFGTGGITLAGGMIRTDLDMVLNKSLVSTSSNQTGGFFILSGKTLTYGNGNASTVGMSGSGNYAINGGGMLVLSNNSGAQMTYTGSLILNGSIIKFTPNDNGTPNRISGIGGTPVDATKFLVLNNVAGVGSRVIYNVSSAAADYGSALRGTTVSAGTNTMEVTAGNSMIFAGAITGPSTGTDRGLIVKDGPGAFEMRANNTATYSGKWSVLQGTLSMGNSPNNGACLGSGSGADFLTLANGTTFQFTTTATAGSLGATQGITLSGGTAAVGAKSGVTMTLNGPITGNANLQVGGPGFPATPVGSIAGNLVGTVVLTSPTNNYTGDTTLVNASTSTAATTTTLRSGVLNALPTSTNLKIDGGGAIHTATFDLGAGANNFNQTVASVTNVTSGGGTAIVTSSAAGTAPTATFTVNNSVQDTYSGKFAGNMNVKHTGSSDFTVTGTNTYTGNTILAGTGVFIVGGANALGSATNSVQFDASSIRTDVSVNSPNRGLIINSSNSNFNTNGNNSTFGNVTGSGNLAKHNPGTLTVNHVRIGGLSVTGGAVKIAQTDPTNVSSYSGTSKLSSLSISGGGQLNLTTNKLIVSGAAAGSTWNGGSYDGVAGLVASGYNGGDNAGSGIVTDQSNAISPNVLTQLVTVSADDSGFAGGSFGGQSTASGDQLVMYTWGGDANLDGTLNGDDYFQIDSHFNQDGLVFGYFNGDFNYDGAINGDDYFIIDSNFNAGSAGTPFVTSSGVPGGLAGVTAVPEPTSIGIVALGALGLLGRRSRRSGGRKI